MPLLVVFGLWATVASAQADPRADKVDRVMETTMAMSVLSGVAGSVADALDTPAPDAARVRDAVERRFADTTLYRYVRDDLDRQADDATLTALTAWLFSDWAEAIHRAAAAEPGESPEAYVRRLRQHPPSRERAGLMTRYVAANRPGRFFLQRDEAVDAAVQTVRTALGGRPYDPPGPGPAALEAWTHEVDARAIVGFLQRYEGVSDADLRRLVEAYESPSGRWYVTAYSDAIAAAIRRAGQRAADDLRGE